MRSRKILSFLGGCLGFLALFALFAADWSPWTGHAGRTFQRFQQEGRDTGGLFYTEVDNYWELQAALEEGDSGKRMNEPGRGSTD